MPAFSSELAEGKLLAKFHTPLKRKQPDGEAVAPFPCTTSTASPCQVLCFRACGSRHWHRYDGS